MPGAYSFAGIHSPTLNPGNMSRNQPQPNTMCSVGPGRRALSWYHFSPVNAIQYCIYGRFIYGPIYPAFGFSAQILISIQSVCCDFCFPRRKTTCLSLSPYSPILSTDLKTSAYARRITLNRCLIPILWNKKPADVGASAGQKSNRIATNHYSSITKFQIYG